MFTFAHFNTGKKDGTATPHLDGKSQGTMSGWQKNVSWESPKVIAMLGISYTGLLDELAFFNRALTAAEVRQLFAVPGGVATLHP